MHLRIVSNLFIISSIAISVSSIKVPVDNPEAEDILPIKVEEESPKTPVYYLPSDGTSDSVLIPPHQLEEIEVAAPLETPATYLLPPAPGEHIDYYRGEEPEQTDWYPIPAKNQEANKSAEEKNRNGNVQPELPSRSLVPPTANAQNDFIILEPSTELELPNENIDEPTILQEKPKKFHKKAPHIHPKIVPAPYFMPKQKYYPTKLYPKKVVSDFKPIPIPISQYADGPIDQVPMARPVKPFRPAVNVEGQYVPQDKQIYPPQDKQVFSHHGKQVYSPHDKHVYSHEKAENQRKLQSEIDGSEEQKIMANEEYGDTPREQEASETHYGQPGRNAYPAPLKAAPPVAPAKFASPSGERTEFRMHGMNGPHSYQFGYDTGKGKNRQFRYEERNNEGHVKGHYGYVDKFGKLRVVNYDADEHGFRAEAPVEKE